MKKGGAEMKRLRGLVLLGWFMLGTGGLQVTMAQWISRGPEGGLITSLAIDPQTPATLYAGTDLGGLFKSSNGGDSWSAVNTGLTSSRVYALALDPIDPGTIYVGTFNGVFKSTNGGTIWTSANNGPPPSTHVYALAVTALNETSTLFVPVLVSTPSLTGSLFTSEMILTNKGEPGCDPRFELHVCFWGWNRQRIRPPGGRASTHCPGRPRLSPVSWNPDPRFRIHLPAEVAATAFFTGRCRIQWPPIIGPGFTGFSRIPKTGPTWQL